MDKMHAETRLNGVYLPRAQLKAIRQECSTCLAYKTRRDETPLMVPSCILCWICGHE